MGPYGLAALTYFEAGFSPLPAMGKLLRVKGASGRHPEPSKEQIEKWTKTDGQFNIALRLPEDVIGLDIDEYKGDLARLEALENSLGKLPLTWNSDSRGGAGGKILFRVPKGFRWQSNINGITIVQRTHRYVMACPSYNRESDTNYQWYYGLGGLIVPDYEIPAIVDLPLLPEPWIEVLRKPEVSYIYNHSGISTEDLDVFADGDPCKYMDLVISMSEEKLLEAYDTNLHDTALSTIGFVVTAATDGHHGIQKAMAHLATVFCSAPRQRDLGAEWNNLLAFVLANVDIENVSEIDSCSLNITMEGKSKIEDEVALLLSAGLTLGQINRRLFKRRR